jgi:hypothetical protein
MGQRYKIWRTTGAWAHSMYVLIVADPPEGPEINWRTRVPESVRDGRFWTGHCEGRLSRLKPLYRAVLAAQGFMVLPGLDAAQAKHLEKPRRQRQRLQPGDLTNRRHVPERRAR